MKLRKGLTLIAFGFLFTLIDLNLTLNGKTLNVTPDFIGWILMYLAIDNLGDYADRKPILKLDYLLLAVLSLIQRILAVYDRNVKIIGLIKSQSDTMANGIVDLLGMIQTANSEKNSTDVSSEEDGNENT